MIRFAIAILTATTASAADALPLPGMGWSTYNNFLAAHNDSLFRGTADAFTASGLTAAGYTILRIDGGWWGNDGNNRTYYWANSGSYPTSSQTYRPGDPHVDPVNYPGGLKGLADHLHSRGMKLGMYLSPDLSLGCSSDGTAKELPVGVKGLGLIDQHARFLADGNVDHLFYDGYDFSVDAWRTLPKYAAMGLTSKEHAYIRMSDALKAEGQRVGRNIAFSINTGWKGRYPAWADEWRTSRDVNLEWTTILACLSTVGDPTDSGSGHWNNADYLMTGYIDDDKAVAQMSLWCTVGAPLYLSADHRVMNVFERYVLLNTEAIAVDQDSLRRAGRIVRRDVNGGQVWMKELAGGARAVTLLNPGTTPIDVTVAWSELGLPTGSAQVRDLWAHASLGTINTSFTASALAPTSARMLRVVPGTTTQTAPAVTWAPHPGAKPAFTPLSSAGWTVTGSAAGGTTTGPKLIDGDDTTQWSMGTDMRIGQYVQINFPAPLACDRLSVAEQIRDPRKADNGLLTGANPWPSTAYAPREPFDILGSTDGTNFTLLVSSDFHHRGTVATFPRANYRAIRLMLQGTGITSAYRTTRWEMANLFLFDTGTTPAKLGDVNSDGQIDASDQTRLLLKFGRRSSDAGWDSNCDLNGDGDVDADDLATMTRLLGH